MNIPKSMVIKKYIRHKSFVSYDLIHDPLAAHTINDNHDAINNKKNTINKITAKIITPWK